LLGARLPWPQRLPLEQAVLLARWVADTLRSDGACMVSAPVSRSLRVCLAAQEAGLNLRGAVFFGGGEPHTPAKVRGIEASGARVIPTYFFTEAGAVGFGCARPTGENDLHFLRDSLALVQYERRVPGSEITVPAFHFTSLLPSAPKILMNVESDDYGVVERRSCGCELEAAGYAEHIREVRSFGKLTGEGVTLVGSEMITILEEVLPVRFGGSPQDYQLLEEEDERGYTRLSLLVSPRIQISDEQAVIDALLAALGRGSVSADVARAFWSQARAVRVKRQEPIWTNRGKLMPLHLERRSGP
jgi:hypothetical protein